MYVLFPTILFVTKYVWYGTCYRFWYATCEKFNLSFSFFSWKSGFRLSVSTISIGVAQLQKNPVYFTDVECLPIMQQLARYRPSINHYKTSSTPLIYRPSLYHHQKLPLAASTSATCNVVNVLPANVHILFSFSLGWEEDLNLDWE